MYIPRHWHWIFPVGINMLGFYIGHNFEHTYDVIVTQTFLSLVSLPYAAYLWQAGIIYQHWQAGDPEPQKELKPVVKTNFNNGVLVLEQVTQVQREDKLMQFANILIHQKALGKVDLREPFWVKHFGSRDNWLTVRDDLERRGALARMGERKNASFGVTDWRVIELLRRGEKIS